MIPHKDAGGWALTCPDRATSFRVRAVIAEHHPGCSVYAEPMRGRCIGLRVYTTGKDGLEWRPHRYARFILARAARRVEWEADAIKAFEVRP